MSAIVARSYMADCLFCNIPGGRITNRNDLAYVVLDGYPVTEQHSLIVPYRHTESYFFLSDEEREACHQLLIETKSEIESKDQKVSGFNIGINIGESAGQTIFHCHIHLIPRRDGDIENPRGGVRGVIPDKRIY